MKNNVREINELESKDFEPKSPCPRSEEEIVRGWEGDFEKPLVSVVCHAYNHDRFIEDAINSFLMQETTFPFEIIIHDDASSDNTAKIIEKYKIDYPRIIKAVLQTENQFSRGVVPSMITFPLCRGKFIAFCEGDDYWIDHHKLELQARTLEKNSELDLCFHKSTRIDLSSDEEEVIGDYRACAPNGFVSFQDVAGLRHGMIPTASCMFSRVTAKHFLEFQSSLGFRLPVGDIFIQMISANRGGAYFLDRNAAVYRYLVPGSWTSRVGTRKITEVSWIVHRIQAMREFRSFLNEENAGQTDSINRRWIKRFFLDETIPASIKVKYFRDFVVDFGFMQSSAIAIIMFVPKIYLYLSRFLKPRSI